MAIERDRIHNPVDKRLGMNQADLVFTCLWRLAAHQSLEFFRLQGLNNDPQAIGPLGVAGPGVVGQKGRMRVKKCCHGENIT